jgi:hypothetical protein
MATAKKDTEVRRIPYITQDGQALHLSSEGVQRAYLQHVTVDQRNEVLQAANALGARIQALASERATAKRDARKYATVPATFTQQQREARMQFIADLFEYFQGLAQHIQELKATEFEVGPEGFVATLFPDAPEKPKFPG